VSTDNPSNISIAELRESSSHSFLSKLKKVFPWFFDIHSLFYYFLFLLVVGITWCIYSIVTNSGTSLYNWDYNHQYVTMTYDFYDTWHSFIKTGYFALYDPKTYLGVDAIGSNSYYGLFDPFLFVCYIFPRAWIPQTFLIATYFKCIVSAFCMRAYLKYMGVSEGSSRLGGLIYGYSGFVNFFTGFPSFLSMTFTLPLILLGIEKVLKEKKIGSLVWGLFFLGLVSFFFLVVICLWGVLYALWRYLWTIKKRTGKDNLYVILIGILGFALGLALCSWVLLPSIRQSTISGRTSSVGKVYWGLLSSSLKEMDWKGVFSRMFELVGDNPGREMAGALSFFFPTCNYLYLPLANSTAWMGNNAGGNSYDAWTSSLFCYTPMVILFFTGLVSAIKRRNWQALIATVLCTYLLFTTFAYYFFYGFAGDGYGRWFIVLIPCIIYFGASELDRLKDEPKWVLPVGSALAMLGTVITFVVAYLALNGKSFSTSGGNGTYWVNEYNVPALIYESNTGKYYSLLWIVLYQFALVVIESVVIICRQSKPDLWKILTGFAAVEICVCGNISYLYGGTWSYETTFLNGAATAAKTQQVFDELKAQDGTTYYRTYSDAYPNANSAMAFGFNGTGNFHSLFNYDVSGLSRFSHMNRDNYTYTRYGDNTLVNPSWAAFYGNKRVDLDTALGIKYYVIKNEGYTHGYDTWPANVPFGSELVLTTDTYRVYKSAYVGDGEGQVSLGHAVDSLYAEGKAKTGDSSSFYDSGSSAIEMMRNEQVYIDGAIIKDSDVQALSKDFAFSSAPACSLASTKMKALNYSAKKITTIPGYGYFYYSEKDGNVTNYSPTYFLSHLNDSSVIDTDIKGNLKITDVTDGEGSLISVLNDYDKVVLYPTSGWGTSFLTEGSTSDPSGSYFTVYLPNGGPEYGDGKDPSPRIYLVGDTYESDGTTLKEENVLLSYEWRSLATYASNGIGGSWGSLFGLYAPGKVKYIVLCDKVSYGSSILHMPWVYSCSRSTIETQMKKISSRDYNLTNVKYGTDNFTFESNFSKKKLVVTALGYDAGWSVTAVDDQGNETKPAMYNLDGGFVGFVAPEGHITYKMTYRTKYLNEGIILFLTGLFLYVSFVAFDFKMSPKPAKVLGLKEDDKKKKKDEHAHPSSPSGP
jgi:uncharacterized membrane protein YfhO